MDTIIAGRFDSYAAARQAEAVLRGSDFAADDVCTFYVNPPGQHAKYPIGGDRNEDPAARDANTDAVKGAVIGGVIGAGAGLAAGAAAPVAAAAVVAGAAVGAYTGSLHGALHGMGDEAQKDAGYPEPPEPRKAGVLVAVRAPDDDSSLSARRIFKQSGANDIEIARGTWRDGAWADFDPTAAPVLVSQ